MSSVFSNVSSETKGPIEARFHVDSPWDEGTKVCSTGPGHMTNMTAMPIYGKKSSLEPNLEKADDLESWYAASGTGVYQVRSNEDPCVDLDLFYGKIKFGTLCFVWEKGITRDFSESIVVYDIEVGRCSQLNEYMNLHEYQRSR